MILLNQQMAEFVLQVKKPAKTVLSAVQYSVLLWVYFFPESDHSIFQAQISTCSKFPSWTEGATKLEHFSLINSLKQQNLCLPARLEQQKSIMSDIAFYYYVINNKKWHGEINGVIKNPKQHFCQLLTGIASHQVSLCAHTVLPTWRIGRVWGTSLAPTVNNLGWKISQGAGRVSIV